MTEWTPEARSALEAYLARVRASLRGTSVDAEEVEQDVREHIDVALNGHDDPVSAHDLNVVLERLGRPDQWVPDEEVSPWRRAMSQILHGPEDWRLSYLCFGLTVIGLVTAPLGGIVLWIPAYLLARAAHGYTATRGESLGPRRWLTDRPLVAGALALLGCFLAGPLWLPVAFVVQEYELGAVLGRNLSELQRVATIVSAFGASVGLWWMILAPLAALDQPTVRWLLFPIGSRFRARHALWLGAAGLALLAACVLIYFVV